LSHVQAELSAEPCNIIDRIGDARSALRHLSFARVKFDCNWGYPALSFLLREIARKPD
jgi:hypothetical protein